MSADKAGEPGCDPIAAVEVRGARDEKTVDPVGVGFIEALARRAAAQQGEARRLLLRRVEELRDEQAAAQPTTQADQKTLDEPSVRQCALAGLSDLVDRLGRSPASSGLRTQPRPGMARLTDASITGLRSRTVPPPPLKAVVVFKDTWSRLRAEHRLRQALAQVPAMAGPLNSSHLVNRALQAMRDVSPEYLDAFMSHIDTLQWLEQASGAGGITHRPMAPAESRRRPARGRSAESDV